MRRTSTAAALRFRLLLSLLLALGLLLGASAAQAQTQPAGQGLVADSTELRVLRQLYQATDGAHWGTHTNWLLGTTSADFATWYGVGVTNGDVTSLEQWGNNLRGTLPASLGQLTGLTLLELRNNALQGSLPPSLGQLANLQQLLLTNNQLGGALPASLGQLASLRTLSANQNAFTDSIPPTLGQLGQLDYVDLSNNQLSGALPASLGQCPHLQWLYLSANQFSGPLPAAWGQLSQLHHLFLLRNQLRGPLPAAWGSLTSLWNLTLSYNQLSGQLPAELANLQSLSSLGLDHNQFTGSLVPLTGLLQLNSLNAQANQFSGPLPAQLGQLASLTYCYLDNNQLRGPLPDSLGRLTSLSQLQLHNNLLTGTLPARLLRLPQLTLLRLDYNQLRAIAPVPGSDLLRPGVSLTHNQLSFAALEQLLLGPNQVRLSGGWDPRWQAAPDWTDTVHAQVGQVLQLHPAAADAQHAYAYQWQRLVSGQWVNMPGDTLASKRWAVATGAQGGTYRRVEHNRWFTEASRVPTELASAAIYVDIPPYRALTRNLPVDTNQPEALGQGLPAPDANAPDPGDVNFVRTWVPRVALTSTDAAPSASPTGASSPAPVSTAPVTHLLRREQWDNLPSPQVSALPLATAPTRLDYVLTLEQPLSSGTQTGTRTSGWLTAPQTGDYTFFLSAGNEAQLWLSADETPAHRRRLASVATATNPREFSRLAEQQSAPVPLVQGQRYYLEVLHAGQPGASHYCVAWQRPGSSQLEVPVPGTYLSATPPTSGGLFRELWTNAPGGAVTDIPLASAPTRVDFFASLEGPTNAGLQYGARFRGYLLPPVSGSYAFALAADDAAECWLSPDEDSAHAQRLLSLPSATNAREFGKYPPVSVTLVTGQRYYLEVRHKQDGGLDHVALGWQPPGDSAISGPVPGTALAPYLAPYTSAPIAPASPSSTAGGSPAAAAVPSWPIDQASETTQYLDGLGRPVQTVHHQASPQRRDLVQAQAYDGLGRETQQYLPYPAAPAQSAANATTAQGFHYQAISEQQQFFSRLTPLNGGPGPLDPDDPTRGVARSAVAYGETQFEASPLNRVLAQAAPGQQWSLTGGHIQQRAERPNALGLDSVLWFRPGYDPKSLDPGYQDLYPAGEVWGVQSTDEQGFVSIEWKDKLGQVVQKQVELARLDSSEATPSHTPQPRRWLRTCYVYDDFGHLRFVLPPQATRGLLAAVVTASLPPPPPDLQLWLPGGNPAGQRVRDASGQHQDGTLIGGSWPAPGPAPTPALGITLQGSERIAVPLSLPASQAFTIAFWVRPTTLSDNSCAISAQSGDGSGGVWGTFAFHAALDGTVYAGINYWDYHGRIVTGLGEMKAGQWQHFVFTYEQGTGTLYRNGQLVGSPLTGMPAAPAWPGLLVGANTSATPFNGSLADVRRYARALTAAEVQALAQPVVPTPPVLPPTAITSVQSYLFHYRYDGRGRQVAKQVPGTDGETLVVYDQLDRPVLSQDASQRQRREWSWTKYDALGRVILSGLTIRQDTASQVSLQSVATADTATAHQYEQRTADGVSFAQFYTTTQSFPQLGQNGFSAGPVLTASYYDDYNFNNDAQGQPDASYDPSQDAQFPSGMAPVADALRTTGLPTRTSTRVLGVAENDATQAAWLTTTTFYDERARPVQVQSTSARKDPTTQQAFTDLLTTQLDFTGKVVQSVATHQGPSHTPVAVREFFTYDHAERLLSTRQQLPGEARPALLDSVQYNELGQVTRKSLATGRLRQDVDYAYNIRGWLTSLNNPYSPNPTKHDLFSLSLHYERGFTPGYEQYNGNLTGQTWRGRDGVQRAYGYVYDPLNRILQGDFVARAGGSAGTLASATAWNQERDNYRLAFVSYDDNGNILTLRRQGLLQSATHATGKQYGAVDNLSYAYQGNRLQAVDDAVSGNETPRLKGYNGAPTSLAGDFQEHGVQLGQEYLYDANGNLTQDKNKGITGILYNHLNLPRQIHFGQVGDSVVFRYTAAGQKVAKLVYQTGKPTPLRTDYLGPYQYEGDSLKFFPHAEGRVLRFVQYDAANQPTVRYQREYTIKDHLGNLRLAYRAGQVRTLLASLEQDARTHQRESHQFDSLSVSAPVAQSTTLARSGQYVARLNAGGNTPQPLGPLTQLGVQKGDTITVSAFGYYAQPVQHGFLFSLGSFLASLFHPTQTPPPGLEASRRKDLPLLQVGVAAGLASIPQLSGGVPKGYLRVLVFDKDSALVSQQTQQLSQAANGGYEPLTQRVVLPQDGYVTAYVGNESDVDVLFDDVQLEHRPGLQVQETQYDPAGLELAGLAAPSPGIRGLNNYRFNGKEFQADLGLAWNHQDWRFFDPQLLRWHVGDPEVENGQESWTPYSFGYDNAVRYADVNGRAPDGPGDPPSGAVLPAPGVLQQMWRDITNPNDFKHFLNDLADFPPLAAESGVMNVLRTLAGAATIADHLPAPFSPTTSTKDGNGRVEARPARRIADRTQKQPNSGTVPPRSKFRKQTVENAWNNAKNGTKPNTKECPTCGKDVEGNPNNDESRSGKDGWDGSHNPSWSKRNNSGKTRDEQNDNYNSGVDLECISCNRSRGNNDAVNPKNH